MVMTLDNANKEALEFISTLGQWLAKSQLLDAPNEECGRIIAFDLLQTGKSFGEWAGEHKILFGKIAVRPEAMLARFNARGGTHEVFACTPEAAEIVLMRDNGDQFRFTVTHDDVREETFYQKNPKYRTPFSRQQMLWARCVSNALRIFDPATCQGTYTEAEVEDAAYEDGKAKPNQPLDDGNRKSVEQQGTNPAAVEAEKAEAVRPQTEVEHAEEVGKDQPGTATTPQLMELTTLIETHYAPEDIPVVTKKTCDSRGVQSFDDLSFEAAEEIINKLIQKGN